MRVGRFVAAIALVGLAACVDRAALAPVNPQAQAIGTPVMRYAKGMPGGFMNITLPDGESMPGKFSISEDPATLTRNGGPGNFQAKATGARTAITCHGDIIAGSGSAECQTQNGAVFRLPL